MQDYYNDLGCKFIHFTFLGEYKIYLRQKGKYFIPLESTDNTDKWALNSQDVYYELVSEKEYHRLFTVSGTDSPDSSDYLYDITYNNQPGEGFCYTSDGISEDCTEVPSTSEVLS